MVWWSLPSSWENCSFGSFSWPPQPTPFTCTHTAYAQFGKGLSEGIQAKPNQPIDSGTPGRVTFEQFLPWMIGGLGLLLMTGGLVDQLDPPTQLDRPVANVVEIDDIVPRNHRMSSPIRDLNGTVESSSRTNDL